MENEAATAPMTVRVLIVDDSIDDAELLTAELREAGFAVESLRVDTADGLRTALDGAWDLVVCDHSMPQFDSKQAFRLTSDLRPELPFVIVSGHLGDRAGLEAVYSGAADYIPKDQIQRLVPVVARELRNRSRLEQASSIDRVTGLPSRDALFRTARERVDAGRSVAFLVIGLDRFRQVNELLGLPAGDGVLRSVGARLAGGFGTVGRLAGDQFLLFEECGGCGEPEINELVRRVQELMAPPFHVESHELYVTASIGSVRHPQDGRELGGLLALAEEAMQRAKRAGRNRHRPATPLGAVDGIMLLNMERDLRLALDREQLRLHYQPQIEARTGKVCGVEALMRWQHPELGMVAPGRFIPLAEESGIIVDLGRWALESACRQALKWDGIEVAVNVSARQFHEQDLVGVISHLLEATGLPPSRLHIELTESTLVADTDGAVRVLRGLKALGLRVAIDDFGTGYSSLNYLRRFPLDVLKVDRSFVSDLTRDSRNRAIVESLIDLGHRLGLVVLAEGVEEEAQASLLTELGCDRMQGFLYSRPAPAESLQL